MVLEHAERCSGIIGWGEGYSSREGNRGIRIIESEGEIVRCIDSGFTGMFGFGVWSLGFSVWICRRRVQPNPHQRLGFIGLTGF